MAQIAHCRHFDATADSITVAGTDFGSMGATYTIAAIIKGEATQFQQIWALQGSTTAMKSMALSDSVAANNLSTFIRDNVPNSIEPETAANYVTSAMGWLLVGWCLGSASTTGRWHRYNFGSPAWDHTEDDENVGTIPSTAPSGTLAMTLGNDTGATSGFNGDIACIGVWKSTELSDGQFETLTTGIAAWEALSPTGLWLLDQASTATSVPDRVGAGDQTSLTGTTATSISDLVFDVGGDQTFLPDADITTTGWTTTPLFSKVNDDSDATVITATAS